MQKHLTSAIIAGIMTGGLFLLAFGMGLGFLFLVVPALPLFFAGLSLGERACAIGFLVAILAISIPAGPVIAILFCLLVGLPTWFIVRQSLLHKGDQWYPVGLIIMHLSIYASTLIALLTWYYSSEPGGLPLIISTSIHNAFSDMQEDYSDLIETMSGSWSFLVFPITLWLWTLTLYGHAWLANHILVRKHKQIRPAYNVEPFTIPSWMLTLLTICALASLIGSPQMSFLGKSVLITLLLPYFFLGLSLIHQSARTMPNSRFLLFFIYFLLFSLFWPALLVAGTGLWHQIKHLSGGQTSSKS